MESINPSIASSIMKAGLSNDIQIGSHQSGRVSNKVFDDGGAYSVPQSAGMNFYKFDNLMNSFANCKDLLDTAQNTFSLMRKQGEALCNLINKAHSDDVNKEELGEINKEVQERVSEINKLYNGAELGGVSPFAEKFGLVIPEWQGLFPGSVSEGEEASEENSITNVLADIKVDMSIQGGGFNANASATIQIGYTDDGSLQIAVDASMDYDLSELVSKGAESDEAMDLVNNFLNLLGVKQNELGDASYLFDYLFNHAFNAMSGVSSPISLDNEDSESIDSSVLKGHIVQNATITLDGANQIPSIAINLL